MKTEDKWTGEMGEKESEKRGDRMWTEFPR